MKNRVTDPNMNLNGKIRSGISKVDTLTDKSLLDTLCIRDMTYADINEIIELEKKIFPSPWTKETFTDLFRLSNKCNGHVAVLKENIIGYSVFWTVEEELHIANIAVIKEYRRKGLGRRLVEVMLEKAHDDEIKYACLEVRESNRIAIQMYNNLGFQNAGIRENYYTDNRENAILMMKILKGA